jgi:hypothetical protein
MALRFTRSIGSMFFQEANLNLDRWWSRFLHGDKSMMKPVLFHLWCCETCGALVNEDDRELHNRWHRKQGE